MGFIEFFPSKKKAGFFHEHIVGFFIELKCSCLHSGVDTELYNTKGEKVKVIQKLVTGTVPEESR